MLGFNTDFVEALPVALLKPLSGGAAKGMMVDIIKANGADSFTGRLASILRGCTETTFYILAVFRFCEYQKNTICTYRRFNR